MLVAIVLLIVIRVQGHVTGTEFSATHFQQREFSFYEIPFVHIQIVPITRKGTTPPLALYLRQQSLIQAAPGAPKDEDWHIVRLSRGPTDETPADAKLLTDQISDPFMGKTQWRKWTDDHPQHAKVFWPMIQKLAQRELYLLMPHLFELAQRDLSAASFSQELDTFLRYEYKALIQDMRDANRDELADQLLNEALGDYPDDAGLKSLQTKS